MSSWERIGGNDIAGTRGAGQAGDDVKIHRKTLGKSDPGEVSMTLVILILLNININYFNNFKAQVLQRDLKEDFPLNAGSSCLILQNFGMLNEGQDDDKAKGVIPVRDVSLTPSRCHPTGMGHRRARKSFSSWR